MITYDEFLKKARELEVDGLPLPDTSFIYENAYNYAKYDGGLILGYYNNPYLVDQYILYYGLHLICLTPSADNPLYGKYLPDGLEGVGYVVGSANDVDTSASTINYKALQEMSFKEAILTSTPYGVQVLGLLEPLKYLIVGVSR